MAERPLRPRADPLVDAKVEAGAKARRTRTESGEASIMAEKGERGYGEHEREE